jgi:hypothetical protein
MSTLRKQDTTGPGLKRIACEHVETAIRCLTRQAGRGVAANEAIEQTAAVLSLIEPDLPRPDVRRDRAILQRLSSGLAELTTPAMLTDRLSARYKKSASDAELAAAVKQLRKRWSRRDPAGSAMNNKAGGFNPAIYRLVADMAELRGHVGGWSVDAIADDAPPRGLRRTYTRARKLADEPVTADTLPGLIATLTELSHQLGVVSKACPKLLKAQRKLVAKALKALDALALDEAIDTALREQLGKSAEKLLPKRPPLAERAGAAVANDLDHSLAETPAAFTKRVQAYWTAWRDV